MTIVADVAAVCGERPALNRLIVLANQEIDSLVRFLLKIQRYNSARRDFVHGVGEVMLKPTEEALKLAALEKSLPGRILAAAHEVTVAEQQLAQLLTLRAAGERIKRAEIAVARMALARTLRNAEDLQRIQEILPAMQEQARDTARAENSRAVPQSWTGATAVPHAGD